MSSDIIDAKALGPRLLVVDDNEDNRYTLIMRLEIEGYSNIAIAEDGEQALTLLAVAGVRPRAARRHDAEG